MLFRWWDHWKMFGMLPYGSDSLGEEPYFVFQAFEVCERVSREVESKRPPPMIVLKQEQKGK